MSEQNISDHYTHGDLLKAVNDGLNLLGKSPDTVTIDDLAPIDEFHIGGRKATEDFLDQLNLSAEDRLLDVGCGIGGSARFVADRYGSRISGIDLTAEYITMGKTLNEWVGLKNQIELHQGSAISLPFQDNFFDGSYMLHVGMNIENKSKLFSEVYRVLQPGKIFGIYDVMQVGPGDLTFPVPWANTAETSAVDSPENYKSELGNAGFSVIGERNRREFALDFFKELRAKTTASSGPPPLGLHILMGKDAPVKMQNMIENISAGRAAPVELIARKD